MATLKTWNMYALIAHAVLAVVLIIYFLSVNGRDDESDVDAVDTSLYSFQFDSDGIKAKQETGSNSRTIQIMIVMFVIVTVIAHAWYYFDFRGIYSKAVKRENNWMRWIEYAISATIMIVAIMILSGVKSRNVIILGVVATISVMLMGDIVEKSLARGDKNGWIVPTIVGWLLLAAVFYIIVQTFNQRLGEAQDQGVEIPPWLYGVVYPMLIWFGSFGAVQLYQIFQGKKMKYQNTEKIYLVLSLASKAFLAAFVAYGFGQRNNEPQEA